MHGISASSWDDKLRTLRPVYTHEFVHGQLSRGIRLPSRGDWLHEGLASRYQLQFYPQQGFAAIVKAGASDDGLHLPLDKLCSGASIPTDRYWQAATVVEMMLTHDKYRPQIARLFGEFQKVGSTNLAGHLKPVLNTDWDGLTADWKAYCQNYKTPPMRRN